MFWEPFGFHTFPMILDKTTIKLSFLLGAHCNCIWGKSLLKEVSPTIQLKNLIVKFSKILHEIWLIYLTEKRIYLETMILSLNLRKSWIFHWNHVLIKSARLEPTFCSKINLLNCNFLKISKNSRKSQAL